MFGLILWVLIGALVLFFAPPFVVKYIQGGKFVNTIVGAVGVLLILVGILSTSFVTVPDGRLAQLFRVYGGGSLQGGKIIAVNGENGPQARILTPGFHFELLVNVLYDVDTSFEEVNIQQGEVGILSARDGAAFRAGQAFADPFPVKYTNMLDAEIFLKNGGQRGPQLSVLTPGKYRLNRYLWDIKVQPAKELRAGFVGEVKANIHANV